MKNFLAMKDKDILFIGFLGLKNTDKSFIVSRLINEYVLQKEENDNLYLKYMNFKLAIIDTPGLGRFLKERGNKYSKSINERYFKELEKFNIQTDNFLIKFI